MNACEEPLAEKLEWRFKSSDHRGKWSENQRLFPHPLGSFGLLVEG